MASAAMSSNKKELEALPIVDAGEVRELMSSGHHYLDVRLGKDFDKAHADGARNISYYLSVTPSGKEKNPHFVDEVAALFGKDEHLIVTCQGRKAEAIDVASIYNNIKPQILTLEYLQFLPWFGHRLATQGFKNVRNLKGGYQSFLRSESQQPAAHQQ
uniref:Rhodanese domain-containing protein n=1 Tax=Oryza glumipatula TaxID=40148 RepID=A0A0D9YMJ7_9ORYZ